MRTVIRPSSGEGPLGTRRRFGELSPVVSATICRPVAALPPLLFRTQKFGDANFGKKTSTAAARGTRADAAWPFGQTGRHYSVCLPCGHAMEKHNRHPSGALKIIIAHGL